jgi:hypothetical protein
MSELSTIELRSGRLIYLHSLQQTHTYAGWLEGYPTRESNAALIQRTLEEAQRPYREMPPYLIIPAEREVNRPGSRLAGESPRVELPPIKCVAQFDSAAIARQDCNSSLTIVWFQNDFLPIDEEVLRQIKAIVDWGTLAEDESYL